MKQLIRSLALLVLSGTLVFAQGDYAQNKTALVIGNSAYDDMPLKNPANDAIAIGTTLKDLGFDVLQYTDLDKVGMKNALREFSEKLRSNPGVGLFYYAGHGLQASGVNYLVPVKSNVEEAYEIEFECIEADMVLALMEHSDNPFNVVILDACRNNPFRSFFRSADKGLSVPNNPPTGSIVAFATQPGKTASDGTGQNGLYTQELVKAMQTPGIPIEEVFKQVRINVSRLSGDQQVPQEWSSLMGDFYFKEAEPEPEPVVNNSVPVGNDRVQVQDQSAQISIGSAQRVYGTIQLTTEFSGILTLDGKELNDGWAVESGIILPIQNMPVGIHTLEMKGQTGNWKQQVVVRANETTDVIARLNLDNLVQSSGRDMNNSNSVMNNAPTQPVELIPEDSGDLQVYSSGEVDSEASPIYGMDTYNMFLKEKVIYPRDAKRAGIIGQVQVQFTVEKNGSISDIKTIRSLGYGCDEEAIKVMEEMPYSWKPALKGGNAVRQTVVVGVPFTK